MSDEVREILESCGYPLDVVVLDCETYFDKDYTLSKLELYEFVTDERFELLGWAARFDTGPTTFSRHLPHIDWGRTTVVMHNALFDALVLDRCHDACPPFIVDTLDLARHIDPRWKNSLEALCKRHRLPAKGDTNQFKGLHRADFDADVAKRMALTEYATNDADQTYALLEILLPKLSRPRFELRLAEYTRNLFLKPVLHFDMGRADALKVKMRAEALEPLELVDATEKEIRGNLSFEACLRAALGDEEPPMRMGKKKRILAIAKTDPGREYLLNHPREPVRRLVEARIAIKSWPLHISRVTRLQSTFTAAGGVLAVPLKYYGAHTGRFSGSGGINLQNLPAHGHELINEIRTLIEAPPGFTLIIEDFSQIEARVLDWLAEQNDMLQAWRDGRQIYCEFASQLVGHRIRKPKKTDCKVVAEWYNHYRSMGKVGILGSGYGMGVDRCLEYAKNTYGVELTRVEAERLIKLYRRTHSKVVDYWGRVERAFRMATQNSPQIYELSYGVKFYREDNATVIELPSTRKLYYVDAKIEGSASYPQLTTPDHRYGGKQHLWGGLLVENIVQATARDILAEAVLNITDTLGIRIPLIVHDDMSIVVPEDEAEAYQQKIEKIAKTPPDWAPGLPVDIEGKISRRYVK